MRLVKSTTPAGPLRDRTTQIQPAWRYCGRRWVVKPTLTLAQPQLTHRVSFEVSVEKRLARLLIATIKPLTRRFATV